jgi:hypothetical protein
LGKHLAEIRQIVRVAVIAAPPTNALPLVMTRAAQDCVDRGILWG